MGLLTKEFYVKWHSNNKKWYEGKGHAFTKFKDEFEVKIEDLQNGSNISVEVECNKCGKLKKVKWKDYKKCVKEDGTYYCNNCAIVLYGSENYRKSRLKNSLSFYDWCYENLLKELADYILSRWDYELNVDRKGNMLSPKDVSYSSGGYEKQGYWFKCLDHPEHESELKSISCFTHSRRSLECKLCNSVSVTNPYLDIFLINKDDSKKYSKGSGINIPMKCPECGYEKELSFDTLVRHGFGCNKCSDGISYPNKFGFNFMEQIRKLKIIKDFKTEKSFSWLKYEYKEELHKGRIDLYFKINTKQYGVEMDGGFHTKNIKMFDKTKENVKYIDDEKDRLCRENNVKIIRIDSLKSEWKYIKNSIMNSELPQLFNFKESDIDWLKCHKYACSSLVKTVCDLWENGLKNTLLIAEQLKISTTSVRKYLKQGVELKWCDYDAKVELEKQYALTSERRSKKVICLNTGEIFKSQTDARKKYGIFSSSGICSCCRGISEYAGKHPITNEPLKWMYYDDYIKSNQLLTAI